MVSYTAGNDKVEIEANEQRGRRFIKIFEYKCHFMKLNRLHSPGVCTGWGFKYIGSNFGFFGGLRISLLIVSASQELLEAMKARFFYLYTEKIVICIEIVHHLRWFFGVLRI